MWCARERSAASVIEPSFFVSKRVRALRVGAILLSLWTWRHGNAAAGVKDCDKHGRTSGRAVDQAYRAILIELMALLEEGDCRI